MLVLINYQHKLISVDLKYMLLEIKRILLHWQQQWEPDLWGLLLGLVLYSCLRNFTTEIVVSVGSPFRPQLCTKYFLLQLVLLTSILLNCIRKSKDFLFSRASSEKRLSFWNQFVTAASSKRVKKYLKEKIELWKCKTKIIRLFFFSAFPCISNDGIYFRLSVRSLSLS